MKKEDHVQKAWGYIELGMVEDSMAELEKAIAMDPKDPSLFLLRAECLRDLGRFDEAIDAYGRSLGLGGQVLQNSIGLGWCLKRAGQLDRAIEALERAIESEGEVPILCYNLACYFSLKKKADASMRLLEKAIGLDPRFAQLAGEESDFDNIKGDARFVALTQKKGESR